MIVEVQRVNLATPSLSHEGEPRVSSRSSLLTTSNIKTSRSEPSELVRITNRVAFPFVKMADRSCILLCTLCRYGWSVHRNHEEERVWEQVSDGLTASKCSIFLIPFSRASLGKRVVLIKASKKKFFFPKTILFACREKVCFHHVRRDIYVCMCVLLWRILLFHSCVCPSTAINTAEFM